MGEGVKRRAAGRVGRQVFIPRVGCGIKTGSTGVLAGLPGPQKQKGATVRQGMSSQEARVSLFGDLTRVSFYGERQGLFFRGTQQPGGGKNDIAASSSGRTALPSSQAHRDSARISPSSRAKRAHEGCERTLLRSSITPAIQGARKRCVEAGQIQGDRPGFERNGGIG